MRPVDLALVSRAQLDRQARQLRDWLDAWDPIGVYPSPSGPSGPQDDSGPPPGEYDCMVWPLLGLLHQQATTHEVREWLLSELDEHFGLSVHGDLDHVARRLQQWWRDLERGREVLEPPLAAALVRRRLLPPEQTPWLAAHWLAAGLDTPALRELAGLSRRDPDTSDLWPVALSELHVETTVDDDRAALAWAARQVAAGCMSTRDLVSAFWPDHDDPGDLDAVVYALDEVIEQVDNQAELAAEPRSWWQRLLRRGPRPTWADDPADDVEHAVRALADGDLAEARRALGIGDPPGSDSG